VGLWEMNMICLFCEYFPNEEMNLYMLLASRLASISSNTIKELFNNSFMVKNNDKLARLLSPLDKESVPIVNALFGGTAEKISPLEKYWNGFSTMKFAWALPSQLTNLYMLLIFIIKGSMKLLRHWFLSSVIYCRLFLSSFSSLIRF